MGCPIICILNRSTVGLFVYALNLKAWISLFLFDRDEKQKTIADMKDELDETRVNINKVRHEVNLDKFEKKSK